ncbi:MAG: SDR family NAD(P)-dependent oxidoreductase [Thermoleophilia bacterium]
MTNPSVLHPPTPVALVTGGSRGLGRALAADLAGRGWQVVIDARDPAGLSGAAVFMPAGRVTAVPGDVAEPAHRALIAEALWRLGRLDVLVNNASTLGPAPQPAMADYPVDALADVYAVNVLAPLALCQLTLPLLERSGGAILNISSDAAVESYEGWGGYGSSKAALDHITATLAAENPAVRIYSVDPGEMATDMLATAMPAADLRDWPAPATVVPALWRLIDGDLPSGRYRAAELDPAHAR